MISIEIQESIL